MRLRLSVAVPVALLAGALSGSLLAQGGTARASRPAAAAASACTTSVNAAYDAQIKHNTTLPEFTTELVNHLPENSCVPSPETYFGHIIGAPDILDHTDKLNGYLRLLESKSKRIKVFSLGKSEEGREMLVAAISDEATIANLDRYKQITRSLADPRTITEVQAAALVKEGKPMYWATGSIHSSETGSPEMLMELAYRLIAEESPFIQEIRNHEIIMITPLVETDGHDREVDIAMNRINHPTEVTPGLLWWGHYVAHDNNRDGMTLALALSRNIMNGFLDWHPTVLHDLHESEPFLYISTGGGPYNPWLDPMQIDEWHDLAYNDVDEMTKRGVIGVWSHTYYDGWAPNYLFYFANTHNAIGRFYETQSAPGGASTGVVTVGGSNTSREWYRPNPPLPTVVWSLRDNINYQESAILFAMNHVAQNAQKFLNDFYIKSQRSVAKAKTEGPAAWIFPADDQRTGQQARLLDILQAEDVEVNKASAAFSADGQQFGAGSYIVRMDQPYSRLADMLLDKQYYSPNDPRPYDDTGWTLGALANAKTVSVRDLKVLDVPMAKVGKVAPPSGIAGTGSAYVINANADVNLATFRFAMATTPMNAAEAAFDAAGRHFNAGSIIITGGDATALAAAAKSAGVELVAVASAPSVATHPLVAPRIALMHNWQSTQNDGWYRIAMDLAKVPYTYIADTKIRVTPDLRSQFDVLILPTTIGGDLPAIIHGLGGAQPIPWENTADMPDLVRPGIDSTTDERGGLGLTGLSAIEKFVNDGGLLITVGGNAVIPIEMGMATGVTTRTPPATLVAGGGVVRAKVDDLASPIAYGYTPDLDLYYSSEPILTAGGGGGGRGGRGGGGGRGGAGAGGRGGATRSSGTGDLATPDVIQGVPYKYQEEARNGQAPGGLDMGATPLPGGTGRGRGGAGGGGGRGGRGGAAGGPAPRIIVRFADAAELPLSGLLSGGEAIANQPAVVDVKYGEGHIVMFGANPMWRNETSGEYSLIFNAAMNYNHLDAGTAGAARAAAQAPAAAGPANQPQRPDMRK